MGHKFHQRKTKMSKSKAWAVFEGAQHTAWSPGDQTCTTAARCNAYQNISKDTHNTNTYTTAALVDVQGVWRECEHGDQGRVALRPEEQMAARHVRDDQVT